MCIFLVFVFDGGVKQFKIITTIIVDVFILHHLLLLAWVMAPEDDNDKRSRPNIARRDYSSGNLS